MSTISSSTPASLAGAQPSFLTQVYNHLPRAETVAFGTIVVGIGLATNTPLPISVAAATLYVCVAKPSLEAIQCLASRTRTALPEPPTQRSEMEKIYYSYGIAACSGFCVVKNQTINQYVAYCKEIDRDISKKQAAIELTASLKFFTSSDALLEQPLDQKHFQKEGYMKGQQVVDARSHKVANVMEVQREMASNFIKHKLAKKNT